MNSRWSHPAGLLLPWLLSAAFCATGPVVHVRSIRSGEVVRQLPVVESPAEPERGELLAVVLTGDGGWRHIDVGITRGLNEGGVPVVGWSASAYFHHRRTPEETSRDLAAILEHYSESWNRKGFVLVGYSRGADILPFAVSRLPPALQRRVRVIALLGPSAGVDFYLPRFSMFRIRKEERDFQVLPEIGKLRGLPIVCVKGDAETESLCPLLEAGLAETVSVPGGHHFAGDYARVARVILEAAGRSAPPAP